MDLFNYFDDINHIKEINYINSFYNENVEKLQKLYYEEGKRDLNCYTGNVFHILFHEIAKKANPNLILKHNDYFIVPCKNGKYRLTNVQVDWHGYLDDKLVFICECKTFLSRNVLSSTVNDFRLIRRVHPNIPAIIFSGQKNLTTESLMFYNEECDFEYFFVNENKRRCSKNPLFKTHNMLDNYEIDNVISYIKKITS